MYTDVRAGLISELPVLLVDELLASYQEMKQSFYEGNYRPNAIDGGRFAEAIFRILESLIDPNAFFTPIGNHLDTEKIILDLSHSPAGGLSDSLRLHIPRTLRVIYDIRNKRNAAHLADGIDPNFQDASLIVACCDWIIAELVRLYHSVSVDEAQRMINSLIERKCPVIQQFGDGYLKTLNPKWVPKEIILALLYHRGDEGLSKSDIVASLKPKQRTSAGRVLWGLEHERDYIYFDGTKYVITRLGIKYVEDQQLLVP